MHAARSLETQQTAQSPRGAGQQCCTRGCRGTSTWAPFSPPHSCHHSLVLNWWIKCEANFPSCEKLFPPVGQLWGRRIRVSARWHGVLFETLDGWHLARKLQQVKGWGNICLQGRQWKPPAGASDATQALQLPAEHILSPRGGIFGEWGHQNSVTPKKTLRIHLTAICRNNSLVF